MSCIARICCIIGIIITMLFYLWKFKKKNYIFSPFNISVLILLFVTLIMPFFFTADMAWIALGITNARSMAKYLSNSVIINVCGLLIFILTAFYVESKRKETRFHINVAETFMVNINPRALSFMFWMTAVAWVGIVFTFNHGIPLLNGGRTFYINTAISPVYLLLNELLFILSLIYGVQYITRKKRFIEFFTSVILLIGTGNRGTVLLSTIYPIGVLWFYYKDSNTAKGLKKKTRKTTWKIIWFGAVLLSAGMIMMLVRNGIKTNVKDLIFEFLYGNSFSDIRDGAFVLKGWKESKLGYICGKTYLAGLISFIPSSMSPFKMKWGWGRFSTEMLFGWKNHPGLRGGNFMEAYVNFGWIGVIFSAILQGYISAYIENLFYEMCVRKKVGLHLGKVLMIVLLQKLQSFLICTSGNYTLFVFIAFVLVSVLLSALTRDKKEIRIIYHTR